jgi:hypothetical protein
MYVGVDGAEGDDLEEFGEGSHVVLAEFGVLVGEFLPDLVLEFDGGGLEDLHDEVLGLLLQEDVVEAEQTR